MLATSEVRVTRSSEGAGVSAVGHAPATLTSAAIDPTSSNEATAPNIGHVPALDGVRGLAIFWVMLFHMRVIAPTGALARAWDIFAGFGGHGVDIFFVLSGFLITGILLDTKAAPHYFRNFYARRALRIFPLYYAVVFFALVVLPHVTPWRADKFRAATEDAPWYWFHLSNFAIARRGAFAHGILDISWSLAIEEQFYLFWPLVVWFSARRTVRLICMSLVLLSCGSRIALTLTGASPIAVYTLTFCRLDGLALGALTALAVRENSTSTIRGFLGGLSVVSCALLGVVLVPASSRLMHAIDVGLVFLAVSLATTCGILTVFVTPGGKVVRILSARALTTLGRFSYGMYLFHYPLMAAIRDTVLKPSRMPSIFGSSLPSELAFSAVGISAALLAAFVSWHGYEKHFLKLKQRF